LVEDCRSEPLGVASYTWGKNILNARVYP
jgi:hypothetical protein